MANRWLSSKAVRWVGKRFSYLSIQLSICLLLSAYIYSEGEVIISLDEDSPADETSLPSSTGKVKKEIDQPSAAKKEIKKIYKSGVKLQKKKKLLSAIVKYKEVLSRDPYHKVARKHLSEIYTKTKIDLDDKKIYKSEDVYYAQGVIYFINDDLTAALNEWGKCLAITPMNEEVKIFFEQTKDRLAEEYERDKQKKKEEKYNRYLEKGVELFNAAKYSEASEKFQQVLNLSPGHASALYYMEQIGEISSASGPRPASKRKSEKKPSGNKDPVSISYERAEDFYNQGLREYAAGHLREAVDLWEKCLKYNPSHERAMININKAKASLKKE